MNSAMKCALTRDIKIGLQNFSALDTFLPGIVKPTHAEVLAKQMVDSIRRVGYATTIASRTPSVSTATPCSGHFDPLKAAIYHLNSGDFEEACWCVFLATHCGQHKKRWLLAEQIYGELTPSAVWTWNAITTNFAAFSAWYLGNLTGITGTFGNHRKYERLNKARTVQTISSYISWVQSHGGHAQLFDTAITGASGNANAAFEYLYKDMSCVERFGRIGKFDYLTMLGKLRLANIEPGHAYLRDSTGPIRGVKLLLKGSKSKQVTYAHADKVILKLATHLPIGYMCMQVMEDGICNWQKHPDKYVHFGG